MLTCAMADAPDTADMVESAALLPTVLVGTGLTVRSDCVALAVIGTGPDTACFISVEFTAVCLSFVVLRVFDKSEWVMPRACLSPCAVLTASVPCGSVLLLLTLFFWAVEILWLSLLMPVPLF